MIRIAGHGGAAVDPNLAAIAMDVVGPPGAQPGRGTMQGRA